MNSAFTFSSGGGGRVAKFRARLLSRTEILAKSAAARVFSVAWRLNDRVSPTFDDFFTVHLLQDASRVFQENGAAICTHFASPRQ